jgi:hypothetical protein
MPAHRFSNTRQIIRASNSGGAKEEIHIYGQRWRHNGQSAKRAQDNDVARGEFPPINEGCGHRRLHFCRAELNQAMPMPSREGVFKSFRKIAGERRCVIGFFEPQTPVRRQSQ